MPHGPIATETRESCFTVYARYQLQRARALVRGGPQGDMKAHGSTWSRGAGPAEPLYEVLIENVKLAYPMNGITIVLYIDFYGMTGFI